MRFGNVLERFAEHSPATVMFRGVLENTVTAELLDEMFQATARRQQQRELLFSSLVELLALVASGSRKSVHEAYRAQKERFTVSVTSVYNKLQGVEPEVSRQMVRQTALRMAPVVDRLQPRRGAPLPGRRVKIIDGTHLAATEHRIEELRGVAAGPLPGFALVVLDPQRMLLSDIFPCEDAHAQERSLLPQVLESVEPGEVWIADRNFCTSAFLFGLLWRGAAFVIRQHKQNVPWEPVTKQRRVGRSATGTLYEQKVRITAEEGHQLVIRRITIKLDKPTREGEREIHLLTNLSPEEAAARTVASLYRDRWTVEAAFGELDQALCGEINTLGYPAAALFSFSVAVLLYNVISLIKTALAAGSKRQKREEISGYYLACELSVTYQGMMIAVPPGKWSCFAGLGADELAAALKALAAKVRPGRFRKTSRGPKRRPPPRRYDKRQPHVATARVLAERKRR